MTRTLTLLAILSFAAAAFAADDCQQVSILSCGTTQATLSASDCAATDASRYRLWQFSGSAGDTVAVEMASTSFDAYLVLLDPSGKPVADNDDAVSGNTNSRIEFTLTTGGTWTVVANSLQANQSGDYTITLSCPAAPGPRRRAAGH